MALTHSHYLRYRRGGSVYTKYGNTTKQTTPSIAFRAGGKTYYIPLTKANPTASLPIGVRYNNNTYRIGTASATFTVPQLMFSMGVFIYEGFSVSGGGFDQSWKLSAKMYNASKVEVSKQLDNPQTFSSSKTSSSDSYILCQPAAFTQVAYIRLFITVFGSTYSTDYIPTPAQYVGVSASITVT